MRQRASLAQITPGRVYTLPPILLAGDAGVGKTAFAEAVARSLGLPVRRVDMASSTASFVLSGSHSSWASARPGAVWALLHGSASSGVMLVDEIDKAADSNHPPLGPLYKLLEPSTAKRAGPIRLNTNQGFDKWNSVAQAACGIAGSDAK